MKIINALYLHTIMANYRIPESQMPGFSALIQISDEQFDLLLETLRKFPSGAGLEAFQVVLKERLPNSSFENLASVIFSFGTLLSKTKNHPYEDAVLGLSNAYISSSKIKLNSSQEEMLLSRLQKIFDNYHNLRNTFKAYNLLSSNENVFIDAQIISDVRIIFNEDLDDQDRNAVIIHRLKIECDSRENSKDFYFALDSKDLIKLSQQIQRAIQKEELIKTNYSSSMSFIDITD